mgnify:CR=1 FL=1
MTKIGIFGGSFDPITIAHLKVCEEALKYLDEIWILPCYVSLFGKNLTDANHRLKMCKMSLRDYNHKIKICDFEIINKIENSSTFEIIKLLIENYNLDLTNLYFIIGSDNLINLNKFKNYDELVTKLKFIVIPRANNYYHIDNNLYKDINYILVNCVCIDGSSTMVRNNFENNQNLLLENVKEYIIKNNLYNIKK